ncbi:hypothetical protein LQV05_002277 [Cryptococcus neoformans]|nr:hypothetical protein C356_06563 [Cryptococcus neoformans var. grubii c45]OXB33850.1 hypothetical protein J007_06486 [Cryptococcus neoformans var. grubii]OXC57994.1 hypothetical protein C358_06581 [Cryptococcus neoformans var. grubii MW-RSA852]UOH85453.1 hypothetical protein LQV05_002277 [Cryptococcus neoformans]
MTEYWVSKKQYWCKYCNIWIRDDAPSRRQHETGLKHIGNKERFIRDLYRGGEKAKKEKAQEAAEMARIDAAAAAAYAHDTASGAVRPSSLASSSASPAPSSSIAKARDSRPKDKFSNYSTAAQLGFVDPDAEKSAYEIEQEIKGRAGEPGQWEEVVMPSPLTEASMSITGAKRNREEEDEEGEGWKFEHKGKKPVHDPYDDDWDPSSLKGLKVKKKEETLFRDKKMKVEEEVVKQEPSMQAWQQVQPTDGSGLQKEGWTGRIEMKPKTKGSDKVFIPGGGWVKVEGSLADEGKREEPEAAEDVKPDMTKLEEEASVKATAFASKVMKEEPDVKLDISAPSVSEPTPSGGSMFKKRRPPPSNRKK